MVISILGCGWYGQALAAALLKKGYIVKGSATLPDKLGLLIALGIQPYVVKFDADSTTVGPTFFECDILIISIPPRLKAGEVEYYLYKIQRVIKTCVQYQVGKVIYISSTGVYGEHNCGVNELNEPKPDTATGSILSEAENLFQKEPAFKTTIIRFGGLIGPGRHPGRFFTGKTNIPNGLAPVNLVHQSDCVAITLAIVEQDAFGYLFNAVSPDHPLKSGYYTEMALKAALPLPEFVNEAKSWKIVNSINLSKVLGYKFIHQHLNQYAFDAAQLM